MTINIQFIIYLLGLTYYFALVMQSLFMGFYCLSIQKMFLCIRNEGYKGGDVWLILLPIIVEN